MTPIPHTKIPRGGRPGLLFLTPCLPYPPDRGDRLRWFRLLQHLSNRFQIHLGCITDPHCPPSHYARVRALCDETCFIAPSIFSRDSVDPVLKGWIERMRGEQRVRAMFAGSVRMAAYLAFGEGLQRIVDYVDIGSDRWRYCDAKRNWLARVRAAHRLRRIRDEEAQAATHADYLLFPSEPEAALFREQVPLLASKVRTVTNGVDSEYFSPTTLHRNPYGPGTRPLVFAGAMDNWANAEAAIWFARRAFPALRSSNPALQFYVVGARPGVAVRALGRRSGIVVTGAVADVRPYLAHAALVLAPLQVPHGLQNKVLEAMSMQQLVLATPAALAGLDVTPGREVMEADGPEQFVSGVRDALRSGCREQFGKAARARVQRDFSWTSRLGALDRLLAAPAPQFAVVR